MDRRSEAPYVSAPPPSGDPAVHYEDAVATEDEVSGFLKKNAEALNHNPLAALDEPPIDHPERSQSLPKGSWDVLHQSSQRSKCQDWPFIILFVLVMGFGLFFGIRGSTKITNPASFCNLISSSVLDSALPSSTLAGSLYDGCIHHIVSNDLRTASAVPHIDSSPSSDSSPNILATRSHPTAYYSSFVQNTSSKPSRHALSFSLEKSQMVPHPTPHCPPSSLPASIQWYQVQPPLSRLALITFLITAWSSLNSTSPTTTETATIFSTCAGVDLSRSSQSVTLQKSKDAVLTCIKDKMNSLGVSHDTVTSITSGCIEPAISPPDGKDASRVLGCLRLATSAIGPSGSGADLAAQLVDTCVTPFANGTADARGIAARCAELVLEKTLGKMEVFAIIKQAIVGDLGTKAAETFNDQCLWKTVGEFSASKGFDLTNCLFQGLAGKFCRDVLSAGPNSIAGGIGIYFNSFRDRVSQSALKLAKTFLTVVIVGFGMATLWMSILVLFGEGLIKFSIVYSMIVNFVILNIPGGVVLAVILLTKMAWYIWTWHHIRFASKLLNISLKYLKRNPQLFFLATFLFIWNAAWCFVFTCAYLDLYSPDVLAGGPSIGYFAIVLVILGFFWSYEVWKGVLAVSVAGAIGTWYYYRPDGKPLSKSKSTNLQIRHPMLRSFLHAITLSFGTICFSSLVLAILKTAHYMYRRARNSRKPIVRTIVLALLSCLEWILKVFNSYALVRVGLRHEGYCTAARRTAELIRVRGVEAVVYDDCVEKVVGGGRWVGAIVVGFVGFVTAKAGFRLDWDIGKSFMVLVISILFSLSILSIMASTVETSVATVFVCLAENPEAFLLNHPIECAKLARIVRGRCEVMGWEVPPEIDALYRRTAGSGGEIDEVAGKVGVVEALRWLRKNILDAFL
ncbi:plasma-membrane choline transporter-domain-containing protein [Chytridium lagenaria]|nr:plasma-membrane choline transporter-domain-containing protein [Chytridium lagenaria]